MKDAEALATIANDVVARARRAGADDAEAYVCGIDGSVIGHMGSYVNLREINDGGIAVRLNLGAKSCGAHGYGLTERARDRVIQDAIERARSLPDTKRATLFPEPRAADNPNRVHDAFHDPDADTIAAMADSLAAPLRDDPEIDYYSVSLSTQTYAFAVANSRGLSLWDHDARQSLVVEARARSASGPRTAREEHSARVPATEHLDLGQFAAEAARKAREATRAKPLPKATDHVVLAPICFAHLLASWLPALNGSLVNQSRTPLAGRLDERVASERLTVMDTPRGPHGARNQRMDDVGTPTRNAPLVENGVLKTFLYNLRAGQEAGVEPTGHHFRPLIQRWAGGLAIETVSINVKPGRDAFDDLVSGLDRGVVLAAPFLGAHTANLLTGDFGFVCPLAYYVEDGEVVHALPSVSVGGNVHRVLEKIESVGRDPSLLLPGSIPAVRARGVACAT